MIDRGWPHNRHGKTSGHVRQGRFKAFPIQDGAHLATCSAASSETRRGPNSRRGPSTGSSRACRDGSPERRRFWSNIFARGALRNRPRSADPTRSNAMPRPRFSLRRTMPFVALTAVALGCVIPAGRAVSRIEYEGDSNVYDIERAWAAFPFMLPAAIAFGGAVGCFFYRGGGRVAIPKR